MAQSRAPRGPVGQTWVPTKAAATSSLSLSLRHQDHETRGTPQSPISQGRRGKVQRKGSLEFQSTGRKQTRQGTHATARYSLRG